MRAGENDRGRPRLAGLHQRRDLESFIECSEAAREDHVRPEVAGEHQLSKEEVVELAADIHVVVQRLFVRQFDVQADRGSAAVARAAVHRCG